jgi:hypothetical protein
MKETINETGVMAISESDKTANHIQERVKALSAEQLKPGSTVTACYGSLMNFSLLPISKANTIIVETD